MKFMRFLIVYLFFFSLLCCPLCFQSSAQIRQWEGFLVFGNFSLFKTPFLGWNSVSPSFVSFFVFYIFSYLLSKSWVAFLGAWCPLPAFRSCFVGFTRRLNALLMNLWGRKCSPHPTPPPSWLLLQRSSLKWQVGDLFLSAPVPVSVPLGLSLLPYKVGVFIVETDSSLTCVFAFIPSLNTYTSLRADQTTWRSWKVFSLQYFEANFYLMFYTQHSKN